MLAEAGDAEKNSTAQNFAILSWHLSLSIALHGYRLQFGKTSESLLEYCGIVNQLLVRLGKKNKKTLSLNILTSFAMRK